MNMANSSRKIINSNEALRAKVSSFPERNTERPLFVRVLNDVDLWSRMYKWIADKKAQMIVEYVIVFTVIVAAIIVAAQLFIRPSVNKLMRDTANAINKVGDNFVNNVYSW
jgi:ABC-type multidrug transport system permease subunit